MLPIQFLAMKKPSPRQYQPIWEKIKATTPGDEVVIRVHASATKTLVQGVRKEKSKENAIRRQLGMTSDSQLLNQVVPDPQHAGFELVKFKLSWSYRDI